MGDNTTHIIHQQIPNGVRSLLNSNTELFPQILALLPRSQNSHSSSNRLCGTGSQPVLDSAPSHVDIAATPGNAYIHNIAAQWPTSTMNHSLVCERPTPNECTISRWSNTCEEHYPTFTIPPMSWIGLPRSEAQSGVSPQSVPLSPRVPDTSLESESVSQLFNESSSLECYTLWKRIPMDAIVVTGTNEFVPQTLYKPFTEADKERYLEQVSLSPPIIFVTKEPFEWGISLEDALDGKTQHLIDKDDHVLQDCGPSVSIRINWPGYSSFKRQISSRNWRKVKGPITKGKLAQSLAKTTAQFIEKMSTKPLEAGVEGNWKVGGQHFKVEDLILVSLHHVSKGSWQPQFRLRHDVTCAPKLANV